MGQNLKAGLASHELGIANFGQSDRRFDSAENQKFGRSVKRENTQTSHFMVKQFCKRLRMLVPEWDGVIQTVAFLTLASSQQSTSSSIMVKLISAIVTAMAAVVVIAQDASESRSLVTTHSAGDEPSPPHDFSRDFAPPAGSKQGDNPHGGHHHHPPHYAGSGDQQFNGSDDGGLRRNSSGSFGGRFPHPPKVGEMPGHGAFHKDNDTAFGHDGHLRGNGMPKDKLAGRDLHNKTSGHHHPGTPPRGSDAGSRHDNGSGGWQFPPPPNAGEKPSTPRNGKPPKNEGTPGDYPPPGTNSGSE
ncbi:uncharacterized protein PITG_14726 [Phytophthora infestans T30-4]|uniref:Uncharacterized protein n=1 Tax=Phytophthora infestans (strain T30-4) TaxID=403677 RepID=D0NQY3_PHYIT|nr:uncharacterized protein PITG_14726 [Phytophthora infestans T30-4]EEY63081.1 hypothetical protein PITG_14726 [Phytophthora infestans T30-4]|eukprot:XP_002898604.1 hypothetical protein PITG_14726 [Phytophthora infestans T30-4]